MASNSRNTGARKSSARSAGSTGSAGAENTSAVDDATERIRQLNEQVIEFGRRAGLAYLEAYEAAVKTFADYQAQVADSVPNEVLSSFARAQANFTREAIQELARNTREFLK